MSDTWQSNSFTWRGFAGEAASSLGHRVQAWMESAISGAEAPPGATPVKSNLYRGVWRLEKAPSGAEGSGAGAFYFKRYRFPRLSDRVKYAFFDTRAEVEWKVAQGLAQRGIRTLEPLFFAERRRLGIPVEAIFVSREIPGAQPLDRFLESLAPEKRALCLERAAEFVAQLHAQGVHHRDLHQSNLLGLNAQDPQVAIVDLHTVELSARIGRRRRVGNLAQLLHSLRPVLRPGERERFLARYREESQGAFPDAATLAAPIDRRIWHIERVQARSRDRRCLVRSSVFEVRRGPFTRIYRRREWAEPWVGKAIQRHRAISEKDGDAILKREGRSLVTKIGWSENGSKLAASAICVKEIGPGGLGSALEEATRGSRGRRAWAASHALSRRGIATPTAYALREDRFLGIPLRSYLLTEYLDGTESLLSFLERTFPKLSRSRKKGFLAALATLVGRVHREGLYHRDFQVRNVLVRPEAGESWKLFLIDLESLRPRVRLTRTRRLRNLMQLNDCPSSVSRTDRIRFLRAYELAAGLSLDRQDLRWILAATKARLDRAARK